MKELTPDEIEILRRARDDAARAAGSSAPACSATIGQVKACKVCAPILAYAHSLPPAELPRALEIMRLTGLLYAEIHKPNTAAVGRRDSDVPTSGLLADESKGETR